MILGCRVGDGGADLLDNAGALMPANHRIGQVGEIAIPRMQVGVAHATGHDPHKYFIGKRRPELERVDLERS